MGKNTARARSRAPRGQAAVEYLILISIVLVVALLAANSALNISGSIGNLVSPKSSTYWQDAQISILASSFSADGSASLLLKNRKPFSITVSSVSIGDSAIPVSNVTLKPGDEMPLSLPAGSAPSGRAGAPYSYLAGFDFSDSQDASAKYGFYPSFPLSGTLQ